MKLDPRRVEAFLADPGAARAVLLHGDDAGLITERAQRLVRHVAGALDDPFRVAEIGREGAARLAEELAAYPLTGGRRVVRLREVSDAWTAEVERALASPAPGLLVMEAHNLPSRARLRALIERARDGVAIGCYVPDAAMLGREIRAELERQGVAIDAPALAWIERRLGGDWAALRSEIEKLALYVGPGGTADLAAAQVCVGDAALVSLEEALFAATAGESARADRALRLSLEEGVAPVAVLRAALGHVQRLQRARAAVEAGAAPSEAARALRPPLFFRREPEFLAALRLWSTVALDRLAAALWRDEAACKRTGAPAEAIARHAVLTLATRAASLRPR